MSPEVADRMRTLATLADRVETTCFDVVDADVAAETGDACGTVSIEGHVLEEVPADLSVAVSEARIADEGGLELEVQVTATDTDGRSGVRSSSNPDGEDTTDDDTASASDSAGRPDETPTQNGDPERSGAEEVDAQTAPADENTAENEASTETADDGDDPGDEATPAYRDPEQLAAVYDGEKTFAEMTEALDVDVTAQTVRTYMIEHGVHDPTPQPTPDELADRVVEESADGGSESSDQAGDESDGSAASQDDHDGESTTEDADPSDSPAGTAGADSPIDVHAVDADGDRDDATATDATTDGGTLTASGADGETVVPIDGQQSLANAGVDAPPDLTVGDLVEAVVGARTVYDVGRALDRDRESVRDLLRATDLLDVVRGRAAREERVATETAVLERLDDALDARDP